MRCVYICFIVFTFDFLFLFYQFLDVILFAKWWFLSYIQKNIETNFKYKSNIGNYANNHFYFFRRKCIAKMPTIAEFLEHLDNLELLDLVHDEISTKQQWFMKGRSTTNLSIHPTLNSLHFAEDAWVFYASFLFSSISYSIK